MNKITTKPTLEYDSNPFTLSIKGLGLLIEYAKGVFIALLIFGMLGLVLNIFSYIPSDNNSNTTSSYSSTEASDTNSLVNGSNVVEWGVVVSVTLVIIGALIVIFFVAVFLSALYYGVVASGAVSASEKRMITLGEAFSEMGERLGALFKAEIIINLKIIGGLLLFIVPGIRAALRYQSTPYIIMKNKEISATDAINSSKDLYKGHLMESFGIMTVGAIIPFIGSAVSASGMAMSIQQLTAYKESNLVTPKTHWLNYIGLIILALFFLIIFSITAITIAVLINSTN